MAIGIAFAKFHIACRHVVVPTTGAWKIEDAELGVEDFPGAAAGESSR